MSTPSLHRRALTTLAGAALAAAALGAAPAHASDITSTATRTVSVDTTGVATDAAGNPVYSTSARLRLDLTWAVPDGSRPGDTFRLPLDGDLSGAWFIPFDLRDANDNVVAKATYDGAGNVGSRSRRSSPARSACTARRTCRWASTARS